MRVYITIILLLLSSLSYAEGQTAVYVSATADDSIGKQLVYKLRETLRASNGLKLVDDINDSLVRLKIVTLDPDSARSGNQTVYSAVWTLRQFDSESETYYTNYVGTCGANRTQSCATGLVSQTDEIATDVRRVLSEILKSNKKY